MPDPIPYYDAIAKNRAELLALDSLAMGDLRRGYENSKRRMTTEIQRQLDAMTADQRYGVARNKQTPLFYSDGTFTSAGAAEFRTQRLVNLERQVASEIDRLYDGTYKTVQNGAVNAATMAGKHAESLITAATAEVGLSFDTLDTAAFENVVGATRNGTALGDMLFQRQTSLVADARGLLRTAVARGQNPNAIAGELATLLDTDRWRAQMIARNTILDAHRTAALATYAANDDIVAGWKWLASLSTRTCLACLGLHGREFPLSQKFMAHHPNCRCTAVPIVDGMTDIPSADDWLRKQPADVQAKMIPKGLHPIWNNGELKLRDMAWPTNHPTWGPGIKQASIGQARNNYLDRTFFNVPENPDVIGFPPGTLTVKPPAVVPPTPKAARPAAAAKRTVDAVPNAAPPPKSRWRKPKPAVDRAGFDTAADFTQTGPRGLSYQGTVNDLADRMVDDDEMQRLYTAYAKKEKIRVPQTRDEFRRAFADLQEATISQWNGTSGDANPRAVATQIAAKKEFGLTNADMWFDQATVDAAEKTYGNLMPVLRRSLRHQWAYTQEMLEAAGLDYVDVVRGSALRNSVYPTLSDTLDNTAVGKVRTDVKLQPLNSYTGNPNIASGFTGGWGDNTSVFLTGRVPRERILSTNRSGNGTKYEFEYVVMGGDDEWTVLPVTQRAKDWLKEKSQHFKRGGKYG